MVQNFVVFVDRLATVKIKTTKISMNDDVIMNKPCAIALTYRARVASTRLLGLCIYAVSGPGGISLSVGKYKM